MPDLDVPSSISRDQAILLVSRAFAAFLLFWVVEDITELPREIFSLTHYAGGSLRAGTSLVESLTSSYLVSEYTLYLLANILHISLWLLAAGWFYRCGPRIRSFFSATVTGIGSVAGGTPPEDPASTPPPIES